MKDIYKMSSKIIFLVIILILIAALSSPIVFASTAQLAELASTEFNPAETLVDRNYNEKTDYLTINGFYGLEFDREPAAKSFQAMQDKSSWTELSLARDSQQAEMCKKRQGYIGLYHPFKGKVYAGTGINEDEDLYQAYLFGVNGILNSPGYGEYPFKENIEMHCREFDTNLVYGIILPPSEKGVVNNPNDTDLWKPVSPPGMIQAASRFSRLSRIFPQIKGVIIDDFWANYYGKAITMEDMRSIKGALSGKRMNPDGTVDLESPPTTPDLQLFIVTYGSELSPDDKGILNPDIMELIDGVNFWLYNQQDYYSYFDQYLNIIEANYPNKELITGVYIHNSDYGDMSNESISYMIDKGMKLYEKGLSPGILLFAGHWLVKNYISKERCQQIRLSDILYSEYYPYLGEIKCQILDDETLLPVQGVKIRIFPNFEKKIAAAGKITNEQGMFRFSGYAGRAGSGGASYNFIAEKESYDPYKGTFILEANKTITLPSLHLKPTNWIQFHNYG